MIRKFNFDYDYENDNLFLYDPRSKSKSSIELDDFIIDFNSRKDISAIELLNASKFFKELGNEDLSITKDILREIIDSKIEIIKKNNFYLLKFVILFKSNIVLNTPIMIPTINESSPVLAGA